HSKLKRFRCGCKAPGRSEPNYNVVDLSVTGIVVVDTGRQCGNHLLTRDSDR
ncbi:hypothetical protein SK128_022669, partial [Halocaridina rubra]